MHKQSISKLSIDGLSIELGRIIGSSTPEEKKVDPEDNFLKGFSDLQSRIANMDMGIYENEAKV